MRTLILGGKGQLGVELQKTAPQDAKVIAYDIDELNIVVFPEIKQIAAAFSPDLIINAAAYTNVDQAEKDREMAFAVNELGAKNVAMVAANHKARLIHISTDFVFDGKKSSPYLTEDIPSPLGVYGESKLAGEKQVMEVTDNSALILRTAWLYSAHGNNFVKTMLRLMREKSELNVVDDQIGTPTWAQSLAKAIWKASTITNMQGIHHWTDAGTSSWYDFSVAILEEALLIGLLQKKISIFPVPTEAYPTPAKRPPYSVLNKTTTWNKLQYKANHWRQSLRQMLLELNSTEG